MELPNLDTHIDMAKRKQKPASENRYSYSIIQATNTEMRQLQSTGINLFGVVEKKMKAIIKKKSTRVRNLYSFRKCYQRPPEY